jgi:chorismate mutase
MNDDFTRAIVMEGKLEHANHEIAQLKAQLADSLEKRLDILKLVVQVQMDLAPYKLLVQDIQRTLVSERQSLIDSEDYLNDKWRVQGWADPEEKAKYSEIADEREVFDRVLGIVETKLAEVENREDMEQRVPVRSIHG